MKTIPQPSPIDNPPEWHALNTIRLGELIEDGWFDWNDEKFDWSEYAADNDMFEQICGAFNDRYYYDEIADYTLDQWRRSLMMTIRHELCPKYNQLWGKSIDILKRAGTKEKSRVMHSEFPETLLSGNSDYASDGVDMEKETIETGNDIEMLENAKNACGSIVQAFLDELEFLFQHIYTNTVYPY